MFNKPNIFGRTETDTRRDGSPGLGTGVKTAVPVPELNANRSVVTTRTTGETLAAKSAQPVGEAPIPTINVSTRGTTGAVDASTSDNIMGARLIVGPEVKLKGAEILDCDTLVVEGRVEATMDSRVIRIAENGSFAGKVSIDIAEIHGTFEGELTARSQLIIHSTGRVTGTIRYGKLVADEGCELCGDVNILSENVVPKAKSPVIEPYIALSSAAG